MTWVCKNHGDMCRSYVTSIADELNGEGIGKNGLDKYVRKKPSFKQFAKLVKWEANK